MDNEARIAALEGELRKLRQETTDLVAGTMLTMELLIEALQQSGALVPENVVLAVRARFDQLPPEVRCLPQAGIIQAFDRRTPGNSSASVLPFGQDRRRSRADRRQGTSERRAG